MRALDLPTWPDGARVAVSLTFDVDAESAWLGSGDQYRRRLSSLSEGRFGIARGLPRILSLLKRNGLRATFYVPGWTAEHHQEAIADVAQAGHELGHHGHLHLRSDRVSPAHQEEEVEMGMTALKALGVNPVGYRSPAWELTPETFRLLVEHRFLYDSSCMGDDRPYVEEYEGLEILELPVHWSLDDTPHFSYTVDDGGTMASPSALDTAWWDEFENALHEGRHLVLTMHPEVIGRAQRMAALERLVDRMAATDAVWFARMDEVATLVTRQL
jgi:peptidoglycan-N-acetylglucosamine deacetylase